jgi:rubrerythrin
VSLTRRQVLIASAAGFAVPSAALPAALAEDKKAMTVSALTNSLIAVQAMVVSYEAIANAGILGSSVQSTFRSFLGQENDHATALGDALDQMGKSTPVPPRRNQIRGLDSLKTQQQALAFAIGLERRALSTYYRSMSDLKDANALKTLASIMGCDGQHVTVFRQLAHTPAVPNAFETGRA